METRHPPAMLQSYYNYCTVMTVQHHIRQFLFIVQFFLKKSKTVSYLRCFDSEYPNMHIGVAGNIGSGKTTLTRMLAGHYGWVPKYESVTFNPYLEDYYKDIPRWSFNLEVYFLTQRFKDILEISNSTDTVIQDRTILEGVHIFVANNKDMGNLSDRDYGTYMDLFDLMMSLVKAPDLLIYLKSSIPHLVSQIQKRGREYEKSISLEYLSGLNERYEKWISEYQGNVLVIDADHLDFENRPEDFSVITDQIDAQLYGLFTHA